MRLDHHLVENGYFGELKVAQGWIMAGKVVVNGSVVTTVGTPVAASADVHLRERPLRYASRGGYKLEHAIAQFGLDVAGRVCLDAGASTGGFTDCLLQHGAEKVFSVEVGFGQLRGKLASDPRVVSLERTNISDVRRDMLDDALSLAVADLSYLSLAAALPILRGLFDGPYEIVTLIKPLYEGLPQGLEGDPPALEATLRQLFAELRDQRFRPAGVCVSPLLGGRGAVEFLAWFHAGGGMDPAMAPSAAIADLARCPPRGLGDYLDAATASIGEVRG